MGSLELFDLDYFLCLTEYKYYLHYLQSLDTFQHCL